VAADASSDVERIGPGQVVLVVGPSGAGKDAVIHEVAHRMGGDRRFHFPTRIVTREANSAEDHTTLTPALFEVELGRGAFALHWEAHGLHYAMPEGMDAAVRAGCSVVFNASRRVVPLARRRYANVAVVLIDAPLELRWKRLATRDREHGEDVKRRLNRVVTEFDANDVDLTIDNSGALGRAVDALADWLAARR
jgi:ribose 1,5-bisphosphokinase